MVENREIYDSTWNDEVVLYMQNSAGCRWTNYLLSVCLKHIPQNDVKTVADMGCGIGLKTAIIAAHFPSANVSGFDFSEKGIELAERIHKDIRNLAFFTHDITENADKSYDMICAFEVLEHIEKWEEMVDKITALANKYILFSFPTGRMRKYEVHQGHFRNFKKKQVEGFLETRGWKTEAAIYAGFPFHSPIMRDFTNLIYSEKKPAAMQFKTNKMNRIMHQAGYFLFRYLSSKRIGDQAFLLFRKDG